MQSSSAALRDAITQGHTRRSRVLVLDALLRPTLELEGALVDWSVSMQRDRLIRRSASISVANIDRAYTPSGPASVLWPDRIVRIETGVALGTAAEYVSVATLLLDEVNASTDTAVVSLTASSRIRLLDEDFPEPVTFPVNTRLRDVARAVCELAGLGTADELYALDDDFKALSAIRAFTTTDRMLSSLVQLFFDYGLDFADDALGRPWSAPLPTTVAEPVWTFEPGAGAVLTRLEARYRHQRVYNRTVVRGIGPDREPVLAEARDLNPASPTYNPFDGSGPLGDRPYPPYESGGIIDVPQAQAVADALLLRVMAYQVASGASSVVIPGLEDRDVVMQSVADRTGLDDLVTLDSVNVASRGAMSMTGVVTRSPSP